MTVSLTAPAPAPAPASAPAPATAVAAVLRRLREHAPRTLVFMLALCLSIALLLFAIDRRGFGFKLAYSFGIGFSCLLTSHGVRLGWAALDDRVRRARGLAAAPARFATGWHGIVPSVLVCMLVGPLVGTALVDALLGERSPSLWQMESATARISLAMSVIASLASMFVLSTLERLASARAQAEAAQRQAAEHQLRLLQSQLQPHMLFNTLANLRVLIGLDPPRAQAMLDRLNAFLRATLLASRTHQHALHVEFDRLADYLALMAVRMGPRLQVQLDLPDALRNVMVPPLLLQSLVENSIQHGLEPQIQGGRIVVRAACEASVLVLSVRDTGTGLPTTGAHRDGGFGVAQVQERLATLYGSAASLNIANTTDADGGTLATVRLPLPAAIPADESRRR